MQNTSCNCNCPFVKQGFCSTENECPNYVESFWIEGQTGEQKLIKDCSPKRMLIQQQNMQQRLDGVQQALEQSRNQYENLSIYFKQFIEAAQKLILEKQNENPNSIGTDDFKQL